MRRAAVPQKFHTQETKEVRTRTGTLWFRRKGGAVPSESELNKSNKEHNSKHSLLDSIAGDMSLPPSLSCSLPFTRTIPVSSQVVLQSCHKQSHHTRTFDFGFYLRWPHPQAQWDCSFARERGGFCIRTSEDLEFEVTVQGCGLGFLL